MASSLSEPPPTPLSFPKLRGGDYARSFDPLATHGTHVEPVADAPEPEPTKDFDRFEIVRLYAQGGQGHVFVARDTQLGREVALKELQPRFADRNLSRARFVREAEITGGLEHPGVVPVYALGHHEGGRPYYAMRLIQGRNLQEVIAEFHDPKSGLTLAERNIKFRQLLQRFVSVCQTIAYAHSRCIVHRDIKPSNVLIGSYGEAVVVDWGLARPFHPTAGCANEPEHNTPIDASTAFASPHKSKAPNDSTMMGTALGTPAFMAPEQAEGRWDLVGPASDIYALGTSLYVLVTGQMPIEYSDWPTMSKKIRAGDILRAGLVNPSVPRALEAICQKAMALEPKDRYTTALQLAGDIEHYLADEPVIAWKEPIHYRAARWGRRHRTFVASVAALLFTAFLGLVIGGTMVRQQQMVAMAARDGEKGGLTLYASPIIKEWIGRTRGELSDTQKNFLQKVLAAYEKFAAEAPSDIAGRLGVIQAHRNAGEIREKLGLLVEARETLHKGLQRCKELSLELPDDLEIQRELGKLHSSLGSCELRLGQREAAIAEFSTALSLREQIANRPGTDLESRRELAGGHANRAAALAESAKVQVTKTDLANPELVKPILAQYADAQKSFRNALQIREEIAATTQDAEDKRELAVVLNNLGMSIMNSKVLENDSDTKQCLSKEAEGIYRRAKAIGEELVARSEAAANDTENREVIAASCQMLGRILLSEAAHAKALKGPVMAEANLTLISAAEHFEFLANAYPRVPEYSRDAYSIRCNLAKIHLLNENGLEAIKQFDLVIGRLEKAKNPDVRNLKVLKSAYAGRRDALILLNRYADAVVVCDKLIQIDPERSGIWRTHRALHRLDIVRETGDLQLRAKELDLAFTEINELVTATNPQANGETIYNCACFYSQASNVVSNRFDEYARKAVELLQRADAIGYFKDADNLKAMDDDKDLKYIRNTTVYGEFRERLNKPASPPKQ